MRKKTLFFSALLAGFFTFLPFSGRDAAIGQEATLPLAAKIRITGNGGQAVIILYDNPASRDFVSLLPLSLSFRDYAGEEKIADLPRTLTMRGGMSGTDAGGDFAYYAPWGNLAVFYKGFGKGQGLCILGRIASGKEWLAGRTENFTARIEVVEQGLIHLSITRENNESEATADTP